MRESDVFTAHAARCRQDAAEALLDNVRERAERSAGAWMAMAARSRLTERARDRREAERAAVETVESLDG